MPGDITLTAQDRADARPLPSVELDPDSPFGRYVIRYKLGAGGMGVVYAAWDAELDRDVALKIIRPSGNVNAKHARLRREARAMARLSHPNVVPVFDIGTHRGQLFIAMELVRGPSLRAWVHPRGEAAERATASATGSAAPMDANRDRRGASGGDGDTARPRAQTAAGPGPSWREIVRVFVQAGRGLIAAHDGGVLHRDFKPDNVLVGRDGDARITDFGLARELAIVESVDLVDGTALPCGSGAAGSATGLATHDGDDRDDDSEGDDAGADQPLSLSRITATGGFSGTPAYMAPELLRGATGDAKTDQFSFCVALFEVLYGERPFRARRDEPGALFEEILAGRIVRPIDARAVPGWLHVVVVRGLAVEPDERWPAMADLLSALEDGLGRRRRVAIAGLAAVAAIGLGALIAARTAAPAAPPACLATVHAGDLGVAIVVCKDEYARTHDPKTGALLARALLDTRNLHDASLLATELLATPVRGDALYTLGNIAASDGRRDEALRSFGLARDVHCASRARDCAADWLAIAGQASDVIEQLDALDRAGSYARIARDAQTEGYIAIATALPLSTIGAGAGAQRALDRAEALLRAPADRLQLAITRGDVAQNLGDDAGAVEVLTAAIASQHGQPGSTHRALSMQLNLAYSLAESGKIVEARRAMADADALDPGDRALADRVTVAARVALRGGELARAAELADRAIALTASDDDAVLEAEALRAEIALAAHQPEVAEAHARRAIGLVEAAQRTAPAPAALRSWLVTDHRQLYELWFASRAERGDAAGALEVLDQIRGLQTLAARFFDPHGASRIAATGGVTIASLATELQALADNPLAAPPKPAGTAAEWQRGSIDALREHDALVLSVAHRQLWRITAESGRLAVERLGAMAELGPQLARHDATPLPVLRAPAALVQPSQRPLAVLLDAALAWLPLSAFGLDPAPRPIVQPARLLDLPCRACTL